MPPREGIRLPLEAGGDMNIGGFKIQVFGARVEFKCPPVRLDSRTELTVPKEVETELSLCCRFLGRVGLFGPAAFGGGWTTARNRTAIRMRTLFRWVMVSAPVVPVKQTVPHRDSSANRADTPRSLARHSGLYGYFGRAFRLTVPTKLVNGPGWLWLIHPVSLS